MIERSRPTVSFVIPVRDDARRLGGCLNSIARNAYPRELIEVIVVDNGSKDGSARVAREEGAVVLSMPAGRVAELRNAAAAAARGDILAFVDADHEIDGRWIHAAASALSNPDIVAAGLPYSSPPNANWVQRRYDGLRSRSIRREDVEWLGSGNLAVRRTAFEQVGGFDNALETCEDIDLCQRLRASGGRLVGDPAMRSIHWGDPARLSALFFGELWRGRDNIRVSLRGSWTLRPVRSALIPVADLAALALAAVALISGAPMVALASALWIVIPACARAACMLHRQSATTPVHAAQALAVALVYDVARALALLTRGSHRSRRSAEHRSHVSSNSHS